MKRLFLSIIAIAALASCQEKGNVSGNIENADGEMVVLEMLASNIYKKMNGAAK